MANPSPFEFFTALYSDPLDPGRLALYGTTLRRGNCRSEWCFNLRQADRLCIRYRSSRQMRFGIGLQSPELALAIARKSNGRATRSRIRGRDVSLTALTALWVETPYLRAVPAPGAAAPLPPDRRRALELLEAIEQRPSIVVAWPGAAVAIWLLDQPWIFDLEDPSGADKDAARSLLRRLRYAVAARAAEQGWDLDAGGGAACNLAAAFPVPDSPTGRSARGPRAEVLSFPLVAGDARYRRGDFESLPEPPAADYRPTWRATLEETAGLALPGPPFDFRPIAGGCGWIDHCLADSQVLSAEEVARAIELLSWCTAPGADSLRLIGEVCRGQPGAGAAALERLLAGGAPARQPITCRRIGQPAGVVERFCSKCSHYGQIRTPVEIRTPVDLALEAAAPAAGDSPAPEPEDAPATAIPAAGAAGERTRILITAREHEVNDQALAALAGAGVLFAHGGALVESVPGAGPVPVGEARLRELLSRHCAFFTATAGGRLHAVRPPRWTTRALIARRSWPQLPRLEAVGAALRGGPPPAETESAELIAALEPVLAALGGAATTRAVAGALAAAPGRFPELAAACARLFPNQPPGDPGLPAALGYRLRALKGRSLAGRAVTQASRTREGVAWGVGPAPDSAPPIHQPATQGGTPAMQPEKPWDARGPSAAELEVLQRIADRRRAFETLRPADQHQTQIRQRILETLDELEECLCEEGLDAPALAEGWQHLDELEARLGESPSPSPAAPPARSEADLAPAPAPSSRPAIPLRRAA